MKSLFLLIGVFLFSCLSQAQTPIPAGQVRGVWEVSGSPYIVLGNISVLDSLIIRAGVAVQFQAGGFELLVGQGAKFVAQGLDSLPVVFEPYQGQARGSWVGIRLISTGDNDTIKNCIIRYAVNGAYIENSQPRISKSSFYSNSGSGINLTFNFDSSSNVLIDTSRFFDNGAGVTATSYSNYNSTQWVRNTIYLDRCLVYKNTGVGVRSNAGTLWTIADQYARMFVRVSNSTIANNGGTGFLAETPSRGRAYIDLINTIAAYNLGYACANGPRGLIASSDIIYNCFWANTLGNFFGISGTNFGTPCCLNRNSDSCDINFNVFYDPRFLDTAAADYRIDSLSKCIDAGSDIVNGQIVRDPDGTFPDIGAYYHHRCGPYEVSDQFRLPSRFSLSQNYPNSFNPETKINFQIPNTSDVTLKIYDLLGREVATLVNERMNPGTYSATWNASGFASGVYLYRMQSGSFVETKKLLLLR